MIFLFMNRIVLKNGSNFPLFLQTISILSLAQCVLSPLSLCFNSDFIKNQSPVTDVQNKLRWYWGFELYLSMSLTWRHSRPQVAQCHSSEMRQEQVLIFFFLLNGEPNEQMKIWLVLDLLDVLKEASQSSNVWRTVYCNPILCHSFWGRLFL